MDDHDDIWKPGYDGPPPMSSAADDRFDERPDDRPDDLPVEGSHRTRQRWLGAVVGAAMALAVVVVVALVVLDPFTARAPGGDDDRGAADIGAPDRSAFGGPEDRRLPSVATELWSVDLGDVGDHWVEVIGRELVVVAVGRTETVDREEPDNALVAFDAVTGEQRWTLPLPADPSEVTIVGSVGDLLVVEQPGEPGPIVVGIDMAAGEVRWFTDARPNAGHVGLSGTRFIARLPTAPGRSVSLIDASSGREVATFASDPGADGRPGGWLTDRRGTWYSIVDGEVLAVVLASEVGAATTVGELETGTVTPVVVGDRLVAVDDGGSLVLGGGAGTRPTAGPVAGSADVPSPVRSLTPVSDSSFVVTAPGSIAGVTVEGDAVSVAWRRDGGAEVGYHPIVGGTLLQVATRGGAAMALVDGRTGDTVEQLVMVPGALQALEVVGDGYVALRTATLGTRIAGVDLDGTERWSILGPEPLVVGDRIVVRAMTTEAIDGRTAAFRLTVYGDAE